MQEIEQIPNAIAWPEKNIFFGKYEMGRLLGCGTFAKVYHARNSATGQSVAIKCISKQKIAKQGLVANVKREISIMHQLHHPCIVRLHEVLATKTKINFVMEFVKGGELSAKLAKGRFSEEVSRFYFQQLISAVGYCHSHQIFHRDLKLENLLVDENGDLKVSDFGLSAFNSQVRNDTMLHTLCGTPAYVAPEILRKKGYDGAKVDIWCCGVILFGLNACYLPFNDPSLMDMYRKIQKGEFRVPKWTSPDLRRLISRLLDTNPETRITIDEITRDPWFSKGYEKIEFHEFDAKLEKKENRNLNAFDIISLSSGVDLSGLFDESGSGSVSGERFRFVSAELPDNIVKKIEEFGKKEEISVKTREWTVELVGRKCSLVVKVDVYHLTEQLVMVEVRSYDELLRHKLSRVLKCLIHQPTSSAGCR